jgi:hypothetical protein
MAPYCTMTEITDEPGNANEVARFYPNPFANSLTISFNISPQLTKIELRMYDLLGVQVMDKILIKQSTTFGTSNLPTGIYFYKIISNDKIIQSGRLISKQ